MIKSMLIVTVFTLCSMWRIFVYLDNKYRNCLFSLDWNIFKELIDIFFFFLWILIEKFLYKIIDFLYSYKFLEKKEEGHFVQDKGNN